MEFLGLLAFHQKQLQYQARKIFRLSRILEEGRKFKKKQEKSKTYQAGNRSKVVVKARGFLVDVRGPISTPNAHFHPQTQQRQFWEAEY